MPSAKDNCFKAAVEAYEDASGKDLGVKYQQQWVRDNGTWSQTQGPWGRLIHSIRKTWRIFREKQAPRPDGSANPEQVRYPDVTVTNDNGQPMVVDNKFDDADGKPDGWGSKVGQGGKTQQQDYDDINKQNGAQGQGLQLNSAVCKCSATAEPEGVFVPQSDATHGRVPLIDPATPGALPGLLPGPGTSPVPVINPFPRPFAFP